MSRPSRSATATSRSATPDAISARPGRAPLGRASLPSHFATSPQANRKECGRMVVQEVPMKLSILSIPLLALLGVGACEHPGDEIGNAQQASSATAAAPDGPRHPGGEEGRGRRWGRGGAGDRQGMPRWGRGGPHGEAGGAPGEGRGPRRRPPEEAFAACASATEGAACSFSMGEHTIEGACRAPREGSEETRLACRPARGPGRGHGHGLGRGHDGAPPAAPGPASDAPVNPA